MANMAVMYLDNIDERNGQKYRIKGLQREDINCLGVWITAENKPFPAQKKL